MENAKRALLKLIENSLHFLRDFRAHNEQTKNNLDSQDNKLNGRPNRKSQINGTQKKANQSKKEIEGAKTKRDIVRSFSRKSSSKLHNRYLSANSSFNDRLDSSFSLYSVNILLRR